MYFCYFRVALANPDGFGQAPATVAQALANTVINPTAPAGCTNNPAEPWCFGVEGITQGCARHPATYFHYCTVAQPPPPIKTPMVWVQEAERCDPSYRLNTEQQEALLDLVRPQAPGLVVTFYDFTCMDQQGDAFYQATFQIAAGSSLEVFKGSAKIVDFLNGQKTTLCTNPDPSMRPIFCQTPPLGGDNICAVDQYDPRNVLVCPRAPGNLAMTFMLDNCDCAKNAGDSAEYKTNILEWVNDITRTQNRLNVRNSIEEYKCVQDGTQCQYQYRVRSLPGDDNTDAYSAIQLVSAEVRARPQPCNEDAGFSYTFCSPAGAYWEKAVACAYIWDRTKPLPAPCPSWLPA
jgi:hypothetical protein